MAIVIIIRFRHVRPGALPLKAQTPYLEIQ